MSLKWFEKLYEILILKLIRLREPPESSNSFRPRIVRIFWSIPNLFLQGTSIYPEALGPPLISEHLNIPALLHKLQVKKLHFADITSQKIQVFGEGQYDLHVRIQTGCC